MTGPLTSAFADAHTAKDAVGATDLEPTLAALLERARSAWPDLELDAAAFVAHVAASLDAPEEEEEGESLIDRLQKLHAGDLYLACACARGDKRALAYLDERFLSATTQYLARRGGPATRADELQQALRERLLLPTKDGTARIASYAGTGPLGGWIRVTAVRVLADMRRGDVHDADLDPEKLGVRSPAPDPERAVLKASHRALFRDAFEHAIAELDSSERNFLALHYVNEMSTDAIGGLYRIDGSTVRRRISRARESVLRSMRARLREAMKLTPGEIEGVLAIVESQVDLSLSRLLNKP